MSRPNPYVGPRAFRMGEKIYGRDRECLELVDLLVAERILLLYSPSGAGKTSLIRSALMPKLEEEGFHVLPSMRVGLESHPDAVRVSASSNRYVLSAILSLEERLPPEKQRHIEELAGMDLSTYLGNGENQVLIFDQFEEILTVDPTNRAMKEDFFLQVGKALRERGRWALFAMREDYLAGLDPYRRRVPTRLETRFRLDLLEERAARDAIQCPARAAGVEFTDEAAKRLTNDLRRVSVQLPDGRTEEQEGLYIEPVQLQVVCHSLWEKKIGPETSRIEIADIEAVGDVDSALADYYAGSVSKIAKDTGVTERAIRDWCEHHLITTSGIRGQVLQGPEKSEDLDNRAVLALVDAYLLRGEKRRGATWFELAHDRLIAPVRKDNAAWRAKNLNELQRRAALWAAEDREEGFLLKGKDLDEAKRWAAEHPSQVNPIENEFLVYSGMAQERAEQERKQARRVLYLAIVSVAVAIVAIGVGFYAWGKSNEAEQQRLEAAHGQGILWWERAQSYAKQGDYFSAKLLAGNAIGFEGFRKASSPVDARKHVSLLRPQKPEREDAERFLREVPGPILLWQSPISRQHPTQVNAVALSSDGHILASASRDGPITLWLVDDGNEKGFLEGHADFVTSLVFTPDNKFLASGGSNGTIKLWDVDNTKETATLQGRGRWVDSLAFSPDGTILFSASHEEGKITLWPVAGRRARVSFRAPHVTSLAISPDGRRLAWGSQTGTLSFVEISSENTILLQDVVPASNLRKGKEVYTRRISRLAFSPDSNSLVSGSNDGTVTVWNLMTREQARQASYSYTRVVAVAYSTSGINVVSQDGIIRLWDIGQSIENDTHRDTTVATGRSSIWSAAFSADQKTLALGLRDGKLQVWDLKKDLGVLTRRKEVKDVGHDGGVHSVAFSPDGKKLASADAYVIKLWNVKDVSEQIVADGSVRVSTVVFSPNGHTLAYGRSDGMITLWDITAHTEYATLQGRTTRVTSVAFSPDGRLLASGNTDGEIVLWDLRRNEVVTALRTVQRPSGSISDLAFSPDGKTLASAADQGIALWEIVRNQEDVGAGETTASMRHSIPLDHVVTSLAFSPAGVTLAFGTEDGTITLWDVRSRGEDRTQRKAGIMRHGGQVTSLAFSPNGRTLASGSADAMTKLWTLQTPNAPDAEEKSEKERSDAAQDTNTDPSFSIRHGSDVLSVTFSPDGRVLATGTTDGRVTLWDIKPDKERSRYALSEEGNGPAFIAFSPDSDTLAGGGLSGTIRIWNLESGTMIVQLAKKTWRSISSLAFSSEGNTLATGHSNGEITLWDLNEHKEGKILTGHTKRVTGVAFSPEGEILASGSEDKKLKIWNVNAGMETRTLEEDDIVRCIALSSDGKILAVGSDDKKIHLWDILKGTLEVVLEGHESEVHSLAFSRNSRTLASGDKSGRIKLWELGSAKTAERHEARTLEAHSDVIRCLGFSPDGNNLASGSEDRMLKIWDVNKGTNLVTLDARVGGVSSVGFSPGGTTLAVAGTFGVMVWDTAYDLFNYCPDYESYLDLFRLSGREVRWRHAKNLYEPLKATYISTASASHIRILQGNSDEEINRKLFWQYYRASNWPSAIVMLQQLKGETGKERKALAEERKNPQFRDLACWRLLPSVGDKDENGAGVQEQGAR